MENFLGSVRRWLGSRSVKVPDDWLSACVDYIRTQLVGESKLLYFLHKKIFSLQTRTQIF